jgi:hypothetical protein
MGSGYRTFVSGEILTAANVQGYLADQAVMVFADATARDAAITSPADGMICYLESTGYYQAYESASWTNMITSGGVAPQNADMSDSDNAGRKLTVSTTAPSSGQTTGDLWVNIS